MFYKDSQNIYRTKPFEQFPWLDHGFGTRNSPDLARLPNLATLRQIHSDICVVAAGRSGVLGEADALLENTPGHLIAVKTADCIPILLVDPEHRAVAAVHAGWRGTAARIVQQAIRAMSHNYQTNPIRVQAAIGPGIGECCYEVGPEVAAHFGHAGTCHIDLALTNRTQLIEAGVPNEAIDSARLCTRCGSDFHSYRRDKTEAGRMLSFIGVK